LSIFSGEAVAKATASLAFAEGAESPPFRNLHSSPAGVRSLVKTLKYQSAAILIVASMLAGTAFADPRVNPTSERNQKVQERTIFVTGSLIPQRVQLRPIGTTTVSPVRIIDRREIDGTGRFTTPGAFVNEPSLRVIGH
jgi:hypothetical protein